MIAVIRFPGSNCDEDTRRALERLGARVKLVWHRETDLSGAEAVVIPGGFSYGDYLRSGAMAAKSPVMGTIREFAEGGGLVLGICNGFQILTESGLLPGALARNADPHFLCRSVTLRVERDDLPFTGECHSGQVLTMPVAHAEGRYYADPQTLADLEATGGVVLRYCTPDGRLEATEDGGVAANPNGSSAGIAGIVNERGNVMGMMPHPERAVEELLGGLDGATLLRSLVVAVGSSGDDRQRAVRS